MTTVEIKIIIRREKPLADLLFADAEKLSYHAMIGTGSIVFFDIPHSQIKQRQFHKTEKAATLLRWVTKHI